MAYDELMHYGVLGMKWGVRRYQNEDGTLTEAGKKRYLKDLDRAQKKAERALTKYQKNHKKAMEADDPSKISKYSKYLTDEELQNKINRIRKEQELVNLFATKTNEQYFNKKKAFGQAAMTGFSGLGLGLQDLSKSATVYLGKETIRSLFGDDVYKEMFSKKDDKDKKNN